MEVKLNITKRLFKKNDKDYLYYSCVADVLGEQIKFQPGERDEKLFKHLLNGLELPVEKDD